MIPTNPISSVPASWLPLPPRPTIVLSGPSLAMAVREGTESRRQDGSLSIRKDGGSIHRDGTVWDKSAWDCGDSGTSSVWDVSFEKYIRL